MKNKNKENYKNLKYIPTWKIKEILDSNYTKGINGRDYGPMKEEMEAILWERQSKVFDINMKKQENELQEYENYLESLETVRIG